MSQSDDRGSISVQIVGFAAFVTALVVFVAISGPGIGASVATHVERQLCRVSIDAAGCSEGALRAPATAPVEALPVEPEPVAVGGCTATTAADLCIAAQRVLTSRTPSVYFDPSLTGEARAAMQRALEYYTTETVLSFTEVASPQAADVMLRGGADVSGFTGQGPVAAYGTTSCLGGVAGNVCGQKAITLDVGTPAEWLESLAIQELGHAVGLGGNLDPLSATYDGPGRRWATQLTPEEIAALDAAYAEASPKLVMPDGTTVTASRGLPELSVINAVADPDSRALVFSLADVTAPLDFDLTNASFTRDLTADDLAFNPGADPLSNGVDLGGWDGLDFSAGDDLDWQVPEFTAADLDLTVPDIDIAAAPIDVPETIPDIDIAAAPIDVPETIPDIDIAAAAPIDIAGPVPGSGITPPGAAVAQPSITDIVGPSGIGGVPTVETPSPPPVTGPVAPPPAPQRETPVDASPPTRKNEAVDRLRGDPWAIFSQQMFGGRASLDPAGLDGYEWAAAGDAALPTFTAASIDPMIENAVGLGVEGGPPLEYRWVSSSVDLRTDLGVPGPYLVAQLKGLPVRPGAALRLPAGAGTAPGPAPQGFPLLSGQNWPNGAVQNPDYSVTVTVPGSAQPFHVPAFDAALIGGAVTSPLSSLPVLSPFTSDNQLKPGHSLQPQDLVQAVAHPGRLQSLRNALAGHIHDSGGDPDAGFDAFVDRLGLAGPLARINRDFLLDTASSQPLAPVARLQADRVNGHPTSQPPVELPAELRRFTPDPDQPTANGSSLSDHLGLGLLGPITTPARPDSPDELTGPDTPNPHPTVSPPTTTPFDPDPRVPPQQPVRPERDPTDTTPGTSTIGDDPDDPAIPMPEVDLDAPNSIDIGALRDLYDDLGLNPLTGPLVGLPAPDQVILPTRPSDDGPVPPITAGYPRDESLYSGVEQRYVRQLNKLPARPEYRGMDEDEAESWADQHYSHYLGTLEHSNHLALEEYKLFGYRPVNKALRAGQAEQDPAIHSIVRGLDHTIEAAPRTPEQLSVYYGTKSEELHQRYEAGALVGATVEDPAFRSTSLVPEVAIEFAQMHGYSPVVFEILLPQGQRAVYGDIGELSGEQEMILPRNMRYRIVGAHKEQPDERPSTGGYLSPSPLVIQVEVIP